MIYRIRPILTGRFDKPVRTLHSLTAAREYIERSGVAYEYCYGVAIQRGNDDAFDCGAGRGWQPYAVCFAD